MKTNDQIAKNNSLVVNEIDSSLFKVVGIEQREAEQLHNKPYSYWKAVAKLLFTNWTFIICATLLVLIIGFAIIVPWGKEAVPVAADRPGTTSAAPSRGHIFGLGIWGEDLWIEMWAGIRTTLLLAFILAVIQLAIGVFLGSIWGYFRRTDIFFIQLTNFLTLVPQLILLLFIIFVFNVGFWPIVFGVSLQAWIAIASTVRVQIMLVKNTDYNTASLTLGSSSNRIIRKNILPKILPGIVQAGIFAVPNAISVDATLTFLNFGFVDGMEKTSLGKILNNIMPGTEWQVFPHLIIIPIIFISMISIIFFLVAKVFADSLDPKNHR